MLTSGHEAVLRTHPRANGFCSETAPAGGPTLNGFSAEFTNRGRTTLSLRPLGRTVGDNNPAARGSTGCTLNLEKSKRSILQKQARTQRSFFSLQLLARVYHRVQA